MSSQIVKLKLYFLLSGLLWRPMCSLWGLGRGRSLLPSIPSCSSCCKEPPAACRMSEPEDDHMMAKTSLCKRLFGLFLYLCWLYNTFGIISNRCRCIFISSQHTEMTHLIMKTLNDSWDSLHLFRCRFSSAQTLKTDWCNSDGFNSESNY